MMTRFAIVGVMTLGVAGMLAFAGAPAAAQDGQVNWVRFDPHSGSPTPDQPYDHSFAKQWEANPPKGFPTLSAANVAAMKTAIQRYSGIVEKGGWPFVPDGTLQAGSSGRAVEILRQRLAASGDLRGDEDSVFGYGFDQTLERAVKRFQASNGLTPTGIVDKRTIAAINIPAAVRLQQLKTNLARIQELARTAGKKYVVVNIPAAQIEAVEDDRVVSRHAGVVGKLDRQTPILRSAIHELNFNPVWHLPPTVITKDLVPKARDMQKRGQDALAKYGIDAYGADGKKLNTSKINWSSQSVAGLTYRQQPGPENPLGFVKINFHNSHSVYMHDTPSQTLFGRNFRAASSGCVRISGIERLAAWLVSEQGWTEEKVLGMKKTGERLDVRLKKPVPLYFAYITAWATEDGVVQFRRDIYAKDGVDAVASAY
jgi:murein L,D-transpeptidase YcbB/YkuD